MENKLFRENFDEESKWTLLFLYEAFTLGLSNSNFLPRSEISVKHRCFNELLSSPKIR